MKLVFATNNLHKLEEVRMILPPTYTILSLSDIDCHEDIAETGTTLEENSLLKAQYIWDKYGLDCFADDTGLEVEALGGRPGVYSARYAGDPCTPAENRQKLLYELQGITNRKARFRTVVTLIRGGHVQQVDGEVNGRILEQESGSAGFGYDSLFVPDGYDLSFACLGEAVKNTISHRGRAIQKLLTIL